MKKLIIIPLLLLTSFALNAQIKPDKIYHGITGAGISTSFILVDKYLFRRQSNPIFPTLFAASVAVGKESYDVMNGGIFSGKDILWATAFAAGINILGRIILKPQNKKHISTWKVFKKRKIKKYIKDNPGYKLEDFQIYWDLDNKFINNGKRQDIFRPE